MTGIDEKLKCVAYRVYYDFCVNGFMVNDNVLNFIQILRKIFNGKKSKTNFL